jgi:chromosome partitioning protein
MRSTIPTQRVIAVINNKGGVGKTTSALNMAEGLTLRNRRVLIIDMDPQANASLALIGSKIHDLPESLYDVLLEHGKPLRDVIVQTQTEGLDLAPSHPTLADAEINLTAVLGREKVLKRSMDQNLREYDYIFIDSPPSLGLLTVNALTAASEVCIPIAMTYFALEGVDQVLHIIDAVKRDLDHPQLAITGVVATFFDGRTKLSQEILENVREYFRDVVFQTVIRKNVKIDEAQSHQQSVITYAPQSTGALEYGSLVEEVIQRETTGTRRKSTRKTT